MTDEEKDIEEKDEPLFSELEKNWFLECLRVFTIGSIPSYQDLLNMTEAKREFYYEFAMKHKELEEMKTAMLAGNWALGVLLYDRIKPPLTRSMKTMVDMAFIAMKRQYEEGD